MHVFCSPYWLFCLPNFAKIANLSCMVSLWCDSWCWFLFAPFWSNQKITKWWAKFRLECLLLIFIYTNARFIFICKPRTLAVGEDSVQYRKCKKQTNKTKQTNKKKPDKNKNKKKKAQLLRSSHFFWGGG